MLTALLRRIWFALCDLLGRRYRVSLVTEALPSRVRPRRLYLVRDRDGFDEFVGLACPCGCGATIHLNLIDDERPCWRLSETADRGPTLHPSVWRTKGCRSHFVIRRGTLKWFR